jgi:uncharacterized protein (TIGR03083 family)
VKELEPILTGPLFPELRQELLSLLNGLAEEEWKLPTAAGGWNVKDVALHLLGGDVGNLSRRRDGFSLPADLSSYEKLVVFINGINASWVTAGQRMSAAVLLDLTEHLGRQSDAYFAGLDPFALGGPVEWLGQGALPIWQDVAREYTERWHHQQQIRDAAGRPGLYAPRLFAPVLDTFVRGLPHTFRNVPAVEGSIVRLHLTGVLEKQWSLLRAQGKWELFEGNGQRVLPRPAGGAQGPDLLSAAEVTIAAEKAWKIFTRGMRGAAAVSAAEIRGDQVLGRKVLEMVSVIA